jgi:nitrate reductase assembly molybdenum cofactor insertion protein NarJ
MTRDVRDLLASAQSWLLMSRLFERPRAAWRDDVGRLAAAVDDPELTDVARLAREASEGGYLAAFGPSGVVSPREVGHAGMRDPGQLLADLRVRYDAFGFRPAAEDTIDHVAVETGFVAYLRLKEAYARAEGDLERAAIAAEAAEAFMADHLREVGEPIAARLDGVAESYLARAARLLADRVGRPAHAPASKVVWLQDDTMTCGEV